MKKLVLGIAVLVLTLTSFTTVVNSTGNEVCKVYCPLKVGTELTYESYNDKDKLQSTDNFTVKNVTELADSMIINIAASSKDKKGEVIYDSEFTYSCVNGVFRMSMESFMDPSMMEAYKDMEVTITQTELELPGELKVGATLPDANMHLTISSSGMQVMNMNFKITDRKVEAKESITTAAGTFECYKLSQSTNTKVMFMDKTFKSVDWIAENIGSVRSESYNSNGNLESYRILTNIK